VRKGRVRKTGRRARNLAPFSIIGGGGVGFPECASIKGMRGASAKENTFIPDYCKKKWGVSRDCMEGFAVRIKKRRELRTPQGSLR